MSISENKSATSKSNAGTRKRNLSESDADELQKLESAFERIRKNIPETPYYLTIPQDNPAYRYWSAQDERSWMIGDLFDPSELHLQYMTFIYRPHEDSIWVCRSEVDDERDRKEMLKAQGLAPEPTAPPVNPRAGPRKKITLGQYKKGKETGSLRNSTSPKESSPEADGAVKKVRDMEETNGAIHKQVPAADSEDSGEKLRENRQAKGPPIASKIEKPSRPRPEPPAKKLRLSPPPGKVSTPELKADSQSTAHDLPPLLSPIHLPNPYGLPPLLSPTLPPLVQAELDRRAKEGRPRAVSDGSAKSDSKNAASNGHSPAVKAQKLETPTEVPPLSQKKEEARQAAGSSSVKRTSSEFLEVPEMRKQKVVKLKYGRKNRREIERLLKLPPSRKEPSAAERPKVLASARKLESASKFRDSPVKEPAHRRTPSVNVEEKLRPPADKRPRADDEAVDPAAKKRKLSAEPEPDSMRPRTPAQQASPVPSARNSAQKSQYLTPREPRAASMLRNGSDQGNVATPEPAVGTPSGQPAAKRGNRNKQEWVNLSRRLNELGRAMKHEAERITRSGGDIESKRHAAAVSVESLLTYTAAYFAHDYHKYLVSSHPHDVRATYYSLFGLYRYVRERTARFRHLDGLACHVGAAVAARTLAILSDAQLRAAAKRPSSLSISSTASAVSSGTTSANAANGAVTAPATSDTGPSPPATTPSSTSGISVASSLPSAPASLDMAAHSFDLLARAARDARELLPAEEVRRWFPETWAGRDTSGESGGGGNGGGGEREKEKEKERGGGGSLGAAILELEPGLRPDDLGGRYALPLGVDSGPAQAVRFGVRVLGEWARREGLAGRWEMRLSLTQGGGGGERKEP